MTRKRTLRYNLSRDGKKIATFSEGCEWELAVLLTIELDDGASRHTVTLGCNSKTYWTVLEPGDCLIGDPDEWGNYDIVHTALCAQIDRAIETQNPHH